MVSDSTRIPLRARQIDNNTVVYWVLGWKGNKRFIMGWYYTEDEANEDGYRKYKESYCTFALRTIDRAEASRIIRKKLLDETNSIEDAFQRFGHENKYSEAI